MSKLKVYLGIGSNIEPIHNIDKAFNLLNKEVEITAVSTHYITAPLNNRVEQNSYVNGVWEIETDISYDALKRTVLMSIERQCGRVRTEDAFASRPIDLDVLLYGKLHITDILPDPDIFIRNFISFPLSEIIDAECYPSIEKKLRYVNSYLTQPSMIEESMMDIFL